MSTDNQLLEENRAFYDSIGNLYPAAEGVKVTKEIINNITCHWFLPEQPKDNELVIYIHGGGYCIGSIQSHKAMVTHLIHELGRKALFIEYSLAPEKPYPHGMNDVITVYEDITKKFPNTEFYFIGDSAGGGLIISTIDQINKKGLKSPKGVALISTSYNMELNYPSIESRQYLDQIINKEMATNLFYAYAGENLAAVNTSKINFTFFPPVYIGVGTNEVLHDDSVYFYEMVRKIQPKSELKVYEGQGHVWPQMDINNPKAKELLKDISNFFNQL